MAKQISESEPNSSSPPIASTEPVARVIDRYFATNGRELLVDGQPVSGLVEKFGSPLFVYDATIISEKIHQARSALPPRFNLYYSIKANPNGAILKHFLNHDCGLEVASGGELHQALAAGCTAERIIFAGPGKTEHELDSAVAAGIHETHVESIEEARCLNRMALARRKVASIALRVNPIDAAGGAMRMGGKASPFGIDEEELDSVVEEIIQFDNVCIQGVHLFMGTQILDAEILIEQYRRAVAISIRVAETLNRPLRTIDFGGGWGTPYFGHESNLDLVAVANGLSEIDKLMSANELLAETNAIIEPGRFLVNESGLYLCRVTRVKNSRGKTFAVIDGGMHHHLAASGNLGQMIKRNYPVAIVNKLDQKNEYATEIVGPLCTPLDTLGRSVKLPEVEEGDLVGVFLSGAYARTSSPLGFLSHNTPAEVLVAESQSRLIRQRGRPEDFLQDQT